METASVTEDRPPLGPGLLTLGVVQCVWGVLLLCGGAWGAITMVALGNAEIMRSQPDNPVLEIYEKNPVLRLSSAAVSGCNTLCGIVYLAGAIGLFLRAHWGRLATLAAAVTDIVLKFAWIALIAVFLVPALSESPAFSTPQEKTGGVIGVLGATSCCGVFLAAYAIVALIVLTRASVKSEFS
ncbi:MAG: hypothetical protein HYZ53_12980 [Planctomycetes bacterium]|nr:hypothetical protein [Planctomycetota bacterium]